MNQSNLLIITRGISKLIKQPTAPITGFAMSLFFLLVYNAGIGGIGFLPEFGNHGYFAFLFPLTIVSLAMGSSSGSAQTLHADMQSGDFKRLYLSPVSRRALVAAPILADIISTLVFTVLLLGIGVLFGLPFQYGIVSFFGIIILSLLWAITLSGFSAGIMLRTGKSQNAQMVITAVFPLLFLCPTFMPRELITSEWLLAVSWGNPITYMLEANRSLLAGTASNKFLITGFAIFFLLATISLLFAISSARKIRI